MDPNCLEPARPEDDFYTILGCAESSTVIHFVIHFVVLTRLNCFLLVLTGGTNHDRISDSGSEMPSRQTS